MYIGFEFFFLFVMLIEYILDIFYEIFFFIEVI